MTPEEAKSLHALSQANFPGFQSEAAEIAAFVAWIADLPHGPTTAAIWDLAAESPERPPNGPTVRRAVCAAAGWLAPSWGEACALAAEASAGRREWLSLPAPVAGIDSYRLAAGAGWSAREAEAAYERTAADWNRAVLRPDGAAHVAADAAERRHRQVAGLARRVAADLGLDPKEVYAAGEAEAVVAEARRRGVLVPGELPAATEERRVGPELGGDWPKIVAFDSARRRLRHADGPSRIGDGLDQRARRG